MTINYYLRFALKELKLPFILMPIVPIDNNFGFMTHLVDPKRKNGAQIIWSVLDNERGTDRDRLDLAKRLLDSAAEILVKFIPKEEDQVVGGITLTDKPKPLSEC